MKILRKIMMAACGVFALANLVGVVLRLTRHEMADAGWHLLFAAGWAAVCVYLVRLDRRAAPEEP